MDLRSQVHVWVLGTIFFIFFALVDYCMSLCKGSDSHKSSSYSVSSFHNDKKDLCNPGVQTKKREVWDIKGASLSPFLLWGAHTLWPSMIDDLSNGGLTELSHAVRKHFIHEKCLFYNIAFMLIFKDILLRPFHREGSLASIYYYCIYLEVQKHID